MGRIHPAMTTPLTAMPIRLVCGYFRSLFLLLMSAVGSCGLMWCSCTLPLLLQVAPPFVLLTFVMLQVVTCCKLGHDVDMDMDMDNNCYYPKSDTTTTRRRRRRNHKRYQLDRRRRNGRRRKSSAVSTAYRETCSVLLALFVALNVANAAVVADETAALFSQQQQPPRRQLSEVQIMPPPTPPDPPLSIPPLPRQSYEERQCLINQMKGQPCMPPPPPDLPPAPPPPTPPLPPPPPPNACASLPTGTALRDEYQAGVTFKVEYNYRRYARCIADTAGRLRK